MLKMGRKPVARFLLQHREVHLQASDSFLVETAFLLPYHPSSCAPLSLQKSPEMAQRDVIAILPERGF